MRNRSDNNNNNNKRRSQGGPRRAGAGAQSAGSGAAEVAPPRPGTLAPGADGMTDSATANGDDRDPEIELFVKVGRRPCARRTCRACSRAPGCAGSRAWARTELGRWTLPREDSPAQRSLGWPSCKPESLASGLPAAVESGAILQVAIFLESWPAVCQILCRASGSPLQVPARCDSG